MTRVDTRLKDASSLSHLNTLMLVREHNILGFSLNRGAGGVKFHGTNWFILSGYST